MDEKSLIFYQIVNDNRKRKEKLWDEEKNNVVKLGDKKVSSTIKTISYFFQGVAAIVVSIVGFLLMALLTLLF